MLWFRLKLRYGWLLPSPYASVRNRYTLECIAFIRHVESAVRAEFQNVTAS